MIPPSQLHLMGDIMFDSDLLAHVGYVLLGLFYVANGVVHFKHFRELSDAMSARRIPLPGISLALGSSFQIIAGIALALQADVRLSALGLAAFTIAASFIFLDFWSRTGAARTAAISTWQTNLALTGALVIIGMH
ncbi:DoxX family protein [Burkholderia sp. Bp9140]|uniref:DoxX family protein n=1 Tax=Burkholderia sp. Bp9140 TaxID=2184572 RepID=UPI000F565D7A|nr:DoxX family protein [Burkholderia sp. Bp9140]RQR54578.1 DoxX family protein [Burkholderia sp. Bp9140]